MVVEPYRRPNLLILAYNITRLENKHLHLKSGCNLATI